MHNNYNNILQCVDILSVAFALGLAMEDAPRNSSSAQGGEGSESGEQAAEEVGEEDAEDETDEKKEKKTKNKEEEEKAKRKLEEETEKRALSVARKPIPNSAPTPRPETCDYVFVTAFSPSEGKASRGSSEGKNTDGGEMKELIKVVHEQLRTENRNLMRGKVIDSEKKRAKDKVDQKEATGDRGGHEDDDVREVSMGDEGITEAEFVRHVQDSLAQAPILLRCDKTGLHSNSGRELATAAAIRYAKQTYAALRSPRSEKQGVHSNIRREFVGSTLTETDHGPYSQETPALQTPKPGCSGLHSNTHRELVAAGMAKEADMEFHGPSTYDQRALAQSPSLGNRINSNTEREPEAGVSGSSSPSLLPARSGLHSYTEREVESERGTRKPFRWISQRTGVVATLHNGPARYLNTASKPLEEEQPQHKPASYLSIASKPVGEEQQRHKQERRFSQKEQAGSSYAKSVSPHPSMSKDADKPSGARNREKRRPQREFVVPGTSTDGEPSSPGRRERKLSQNDLLDLAYAALRDITATSGAGPSNAHQAPSLYYKPKAPWPGSSSASPGELDAPPNEVWSSTDALHSPDQPDTKAQMDLESSTDIQTVQEDFESHYNSRDYISDRGQHRYAAQRDLNNSRRYRPYEQAMVSTEETPHDEAEAGDRSGCPTAHSESQPSSETPSDFFARLHCAPDPDPNPDPDEDHGGGEGMPEPMPEDYTNSFPGPQEDEINLPQPAPIVVDDIDCYYPPPPPPDEDTYSVPGPIPDVHNYLQNYISGSYSTVAPPMLPWPWNPSNRDYFTPFRQQASQFSFTQAPEHPYLRVRHQGDRMLGRRPRCGLHIVTGLRRDKSLPAGNTTPRSLGRVDVHFSPRDGDIILRHVRLPGQGAVEIWYPGIQTEDGDSLVRFKLDPHSYASGTPESSNLLIVEAKGYICFQKMWIYMGCASHSVLKAEQRVLGTGARDVRTVYAT